MKLTPLLLKTLCHEITAGNPLWALAVLNEYLSAADPLQRACVQRAKARLAPDIRDSELFKLLALGATYRALPLPLREQLGCKATSSKRTLPKPPSRAIPLHARQSARGHRNIERLYLRARTARMTPLKVTNSARASLALGVALVSVRRS